jgi:hypothetical protein
MAHDAHRIFTTRQVGVVATAVLVTVLSGRYLIDLFGTSRITVADLRHAWAPDLAEFHRQHAHDPLLTETDFPLIVEHFASLRLDLRADCARIRSSGRDWQGSWSATPDDVPAATLLVRWGPKNSPIGKSSAFTREHGLITIAMNAITLPLRLDEGAETPETLSPPR